MENNIEYKEKISSHFFNKEKIKKYLKLGIICFFVLLFSGAIFIGLILGINNGISEINQRSDAETYGLFSSIGQFIGAIILAIIGALFFTIAIILLPILHIMLNALQNAIYILTIYPLIQNVIGFSYFKFLAWASGIFIALFIIFAVLNLFKFTNNIENDKKIKWTNIPKAIIFFIMGPLLMLIVLALAQLLGNWIFNVENIYSISIYDLLYAATLGNSGIYWGSESIIVLANLTFKFILFMIGEIFVIYYFWWFLVLLAKAFW